jgi:hypothetical protein
MFVSCIGVDCRQAFEYCRCFIACSCVVLLVLLLLSLLLFCAGVSSGERSNIVSSSTYNGGSNVVGL